MENELNIDQYFEAARQQPLSISFEETRLRFTSNVNSNPNSGGSSVGGSNTMNGFSDRLKSFFEVKINVVYTTISIALITTLSVVLMQSDSENSIQNPIIIEQEDLNNGDSSEEKLVLDLTEDDKESENDKIKVKDTIQLKIKRSSNFEKKESYKTDSNPIMAENKEVDIEVDEQPIIESLPPVIESLPPDKNPKIEVIEEKKGEEPKKQSKAKAPFVYTFTPKVKEADLNKLKEDLKKEGVTLSFTKLKYENGEIDKIEGTIEMIGYYAEFSTNAFVDFTFKWKYNRYNGYLPDELDIVITRPDDRKSNTSVKINPQ